MKRFLLFFAGTLILGTVIILVTDFKSVTNVPNAFATGGAFIYTKHGGNTTVDGGVWCPFPPCGANRAINPDFDLYYYNDPAVPQEAGEYAPGECLHCHEPMASFGGVEPPPNPSTGDVAGPNPYLLMRGYGTGPNPNYAFVCWYCHESYNIGIPPQPPGYGFWGFYQGKAVFEASTHYLSGRFVYPGPQPGETATEPWPRRVRASTGGNVGSCLNCHTPHGIKGSANFPNDVGLALDATNYRATATTPAPPNDQIPRKLIAWEEALCLRCHDSDGTPGTGTAPPNIKTQIDNRITDLVPTPTLAAPGSAHAVRKYFGIHDIYREKWPEPSANWLNRPGLGWHVECPDCHNPHVVKKGPWETGANAKSYSFQQSATGGVAAPINTNRHVSGGTDLTAGPTRIGDANKGVWGVTVTNAAGRHNVTYAYTADIGSGFVFQLCLKCHSSFGDTSLNVAANTSATPYAPSTTRNVAGDGVPDNIRFTNVGWEFDLDNCGGGPEPGGDGVVGAAYARGAVHPVFGQGCNQPPAWDQAPGWPANGSNGAWCANCVGTRANFVGGGNEAGVPLDLSQNFVSPWTSKSHITCIDCHKVSTDLATDPKGPHGSSNYFILRSVDPNIQYRVCGGAACAAPTTVEYGGVNAFVGTNSTAVSADPKTFCLNCHRADIYGWFDGNAQPQALANFARQTHPADCGHDGGCRSFTTANPPRGIVCMRCHGGRIIGGIHGMNLEALSPQILDAPQGGNPGRAFLYGETWQGYTMGRRSTSLQATCYPVAGVLAWSTCDHHSVGDTFTTLGVPQFEYPY